MSPAGPLLAKSTLSGPDFHGFFAGMVGAVIRLVVSRKIRVHARSVDEEARGKIEFSGRA